MTSVQTGDIEGATSRRGSLVNRVTALRRSVVEQAAQTPDRKPGRMVALPAVLSALIAGASSLILAVRLAPQGDEFYTIAYMREASFHSFWQAYRHSGDPVPPTWYFIMWLLRGVTGYSATSVRLISVVAWAVGCGVISLVLRRSSTWVRIAGGLVPLAGVLVGLGANARPYALVFMLTCMAVLAWQKSLGSGGRRWMALMGCLLAMTVALHYASGAIIVAFACAEFFVDRPRGDRARMGLALGGAVLPLVVAIPLLPNAVRDHGKIPANITPRSWATFYWELTRPGLLPVLLVLAALLVLFRRPPTTRPRFPLRVSNEEIIGVSLLVVLPPVVIMGMAVTSGVYWHRYSATALIGLALLLGCVLHRLERRSSIIPALTVIALLGCAALAPRTVLQENLTRADSSHLVHRLNVDLAEHEPIIVTESVSYQTLLNAAPSLASRLYYVPGTDAKFVGSERRVTSIDDPRWRSITVDVVGQYPHLSSYVHVLARTRHTRLAGTDTISLSGARTTLGHYVVSPET